MTVRIINADVMDGLAHLADESVNVCVTSPPYYGLRRYLPDEHPNKAKEIGQEATPDEYVAKMVEVFREVRRALRADGTLWLNVGDSYCSTNKWGGGGVTGKQTVAADGSVPSWAVRARKPKMEGIKPKDLVGVPWMLAFALRADGWYLRSANVWAKANGMPESVEDRPGTAHEYVFQLSRSERYYYDAASVKLPPLPQSVSRLARAMRGHSRKHAGFNDRWDAMERAEQVSDGCNLRSVWWIAPGGYKDAHYATMPEELAAVCVLAGCPKDGTVLDPFAGAGTTLLVADRLQRHAVGIELNGEFVTDHIKPRIANDRGALLDIMEAAE